jgi:hypothetical protein
MHVALGLRIYSLRSDSELCTVEEGGAGQLHTKATYSGVFVGS